MALLNRVRVEWNGLGSGGTGVNTFYFVAGASGFVADLIDFYTGLQPYIPAGVGIGILNAGDVINDATGALAGTWTDGTTAGVGGGGSNLHPGGVGVRIRWNTGGLTHGRRVRGSTFIVPISSGSFDSDGTIKPADLAVMESTAQDLVTARGGDMVILTRAVGGAGGASHVVLSATVPDQVSWLRSRRT